VRCLGFFSEGASDTRTAAEFVGLGRGSVTGGGTTVVIREPKLRPVDADLVPTEVDSV
jgi:hypothetical protein